MVEIKHQVMEDSWKNIIGCGFPNSFLFVPKKVFKHFLGVIRNGDVTGMVVFGMVNDLDSDSIKSIIMSVNRQNANQLTINKTFNKIDKKWASLKGKVDDYEKEESKWYDECNKAKQLGSEPPVRPKLPNYSSYKFDMTPLLGRYYNVTGTPQQEESPKDHIKLMNRQIQLAGYDNVEYADNNIWLPLDTLRKLKTIRIEIDNNIDLVASITIVSHPNGRISVDHRTEQDSDSDFE